MIVISHDREFLDAITRVTVHLDEAQLTRYTGNYSAFEEMRAERHDAGRRPRYGKQQERIAHLQKLHRPLQGQGQQGQAGAEPRQGAGAHGEAGAGADRAATSSSSSASRRACPTRCWRFATWPAATAADGEHAPSCSDINRSVLAGQRIGILGANGQGKSTLVKTIAARAAAAGRHA